MLAYLEQMPVYEKLNFDGYTDQEPDTNRYAAIAVYVCPSYPKDPVPRNEPYSYMNGALSTYQGVGGAILEGVPITPGADYGDVPRNGSFGWGFVRQINGITDGLSNTLAVGEFVHVDVVGTSISNYNNVRPWILGANGGGHDGIDSAGASYAFKVIEFPINAPVDSQIDAIPFNHLPMGSHHPGGANFVLGDGSVRFLPETIGFELYRDLATCDGGESVQIPD